MCGNHRQNGKKQQAVRIFRQVLEIIHLLTGSNPLEVLFEAIVQGGAREDSTRIGSGGTVRRQAVDVSPLRRVNQAIYLMCKGSRESAFRSHKSFSETLADEIIAASKGVGQGNSYAVKKKDEIERVAKGNRWTTFDQFLLWLWVTVVRYFTRVWHRLDTDVLRSDLNYSKVFLSFQVFVFNLQVSGCCQWHTPAVQGLGHRVILIKSLSNPCQIIHISICTNLFCSFEKYFF